MRNEDIFIRSTSSPDVCDIVRNIIADVIENGDAAVKKYEEKFDKCTLSSLEVTKEEIDEAWAMVDAEFIEVMEKAAKNIIRAYPDLYSLFELNAEELSQVEDIGEITAQSIVDFFRHPDTRMMIDRLRDAGVVTEGAKPISGG